MKRLPRLFVRVVLPALGAGGLGGCLPYPRVPPVVYDTPQLRGVFVDERGRPLNGLIVSWRDKPTIADTTGRDGVVELRAVRRFSPFGALSMEVPISEVALLVRCESDCELAPLVIFKRWRAFAYGNSRPAYIADTIVVSLPTP